ncbi:MAG: transcriptional repressor [Acidobacteria bacterium]|nr:transcriptional repressor [Acidobacteriota bacterium]
MAANRDLVEQKKIFAAYLKKKKLKITRQRQVILDNFLKTEGHLSTEELYNQVRQKDRTIGYATVSRTMKALTDAGLAREIDLGDSRSRFEPLYKRPHHHHIICVECQQTIEFLSPELEQLQEQVVSRYRFRPVRHHFQVFGICEDCLKHRPARHEDFDSDLVFARDALQIALQTEKNGVNFYQALAKAAKDPRGKKAFLDMAAEEEKHLSELEGEWEALVKRNKRVLKAPVFLHFDYNELNRLFPSPEELRKRGVERLSLEEALHLALSMEQGAHSFFKRYAEKFNDTRGKAIFQKFAEEELEHCDLIQQECDRLLGSPNPPPQHPEPEIGSEKTV